jgi:hypothetical protein
MAMKMLSRVMIAALLLQIAPAFAQAQETAEAPAALRQEFDAFLAKFRAALKANDAGAVAGMTQLPFMKNDYYGDVAQFPAKGYPNLFPPSVRKCIAGSNANYDRDQEGNDSFRVSCGEEIFVFTKTQRGFLFTAVDMND